MTVDDPTALIVGASAEELAHAEKCLSGWQCVAVTVDDETDARPASGAPGLVVVYARKDEKETLGVCRQLRNAPETSDAPILLVISRYLISQGNAVKRMGNADFIMTPFDEKEMRDKIAGSFGTSWPQGAGDGG